MTISTFGELKTAVAAWADRTDLTAVIPDFVRMAHDVICREVTIGANLSLVTDTVAQPADFGRVSSIFVDRWPKSVLTLADETQMTGWASGVPLLYRIHGTDLIVAPAPDQTYPAKILYKIANTFFATDDAVNVILTKYPFVYLWGAMSEVGAYLRDGELAVGFGQKFRDEIDRINTAERDDVMAGPLQMSPGTSYGVTP